MNAYFNGQPLMHTSAGSLLNRGFRYGDGLFETMLFSEKKLWPLHFSRLKSGAEILQIDLPTEWDEQLNFLSAFVPNKGEDSLIRLFLHRKPGGLYVPEQATSDWLLTVEPYTTSLKTIKSCAIAETVQLHWQPYSFAKTLSGLPYVLAGQEKKKRALDDLILLNNDGYIAEASSSNLFWYSKGHWKTPSLKSGCIAGVRRAQILELFAQHEILVYEGLFVPEELNEAQLIFACNIKGIRPLQYWNGRMLNLDLPHFISDAIPLPVL